MKSITRSEWANIIFMLAVVLGAFVRFAPTALAGFPINDGGMFAAMVDDLKNSAYALPVFTSYNAGNIPFAYPPIGFYLGRLAGDLLGLDAVSALRWVPAFFASLSVPAFFFLALRLTKTRLHAAFATLFFALMPRAFSWFVMGGGLTRSPGQFFMLLTLICVLRLYEKGQRRDIFLSGLFGALAVMSHPEAAVHTAVSAVFLWLVVARTRTTFLNSVLVGALVLLFTAPWWVTVVSRHGLAPLLAAAQTGSKLLAIFHLVFFSFTEEPYATFLAILGLIGLVLHLARRDTLLPLWLVLPFFVEGRSAAGPAAIPLAMLAASGFVDVVLAALRGSGKESASEKVSGLEQGVFIYLLLYLIFSAYQFGWNISTATLYPSDQQAMTWVRQNTPAEARFVVLTGARSVSCDSTPEWFPALAARRSLYTVQGTEWTLGDEFGAFVQQADDLQACVADGLPCVEALTAAEEFEYVYVSRVMRSENCRPLAYNHTFPYLVAGLKADEHYTVAYENDEVIIFEKK